MAFKNYSGLRLLVVEDGLFLNERTKTLLVNMGVAVFCIDQDEAAGINALEQRPDGAVIDINLPPEIALSICEELQAIGVPFVFASAEPRRPEKSRYRGFHLCADKSEIDVLLGALFTDGVLN